MSPLYHLGRKLDLEPGKSLGVVGFGRVGKSVSEKAGAFGFDVLASDPMMSADAVTHRPNRRGAHTYHDESRSGLAREASVHLVVLLRVTDESHFTDSLVSFQEFGHFSQGYPRRALDGEAVDPGADRRES